MVLYSRVHGGLKGSSKEIDSASLILIAPQSYVHVHTTLNMKLMLTQTHTENNFNNIIILQELIWGGVVPQAH